MHVYTNAQSVKLLVNGEPTHGGDEQRVPFFGMVSFDGVPYQHGNLTAVGLDASGSAIASHSVLSQGHVVGVVVSVDAPSKETGSLTL